VEEEYINGDGATKMSAKCLHPGCTNIFSLQKGVGNGHMPRYIKTHAKKDEQSRIGSSPTAGKVFSSMINIVKEML
jgi:hypothetical protein